MRVTVYITDESVGVENRPPGVEVEIIDYRTESLKAARVVVIDERGDECVRHLLSDDTKYGFTP